MTNNINAELSREANKALGYIQVPGVDDPLEMDEDDADIQRAVEMRSNPVTIVAYGGDADLDDLWAYSPVMTQVLDVARGQMVSPMTLLMSVLAYTAQFIPPHVVLAPAVGGVASLNTFTALVGASGGGKGASASVVDQCIDFANVVDAQNLGSGEGIGASFGAIAKGKEEWRRNAVLLQAQEIGTMEKTLERSGATLKQELNKAWSGERLGFSNRDTTRSIQPGDHRYRLNVIVGAQPEMSSVLLSPDSQGSGFAQRWFFANVDDLDARREYETPSSAIPWPGVKLSDDLERPDPLADMGKPEREFEVIALSPRLIEAVRIAREYRVRQGVFDPLDAHAVLMREKLAAQLGLLHGKADKLGDDEWDLAGALMRHHRQTRDAVQRELRALAERQGRARAEASGRNAAVSEEAKERADFERVLEHAQRVIADMPKDGMSGSDWNKRFTSNVRRTHQEAVEEELIQRGRLVREPVRYRGQDGHRYRRGHVQ